MLIKNRINYFFITPLFLLTISKSLYSVEQEVIEQEIRAEKIQEEAQKKDDVLIEQINDAIKENDESKLKELLLEKIQLNMKSPKNPLLQAVWFDKVPMAKLLIEHGADVNCHCLKFSTVLAFVRSLEMLNLFLEHDADLELSMDDLDTHLLIRLIQQEKYCMIDKLLEYQDINAGYVWHRYTHVTPLMAAVLADKYNVVEHLLKKGANPNAAIEPFVYQKEYSTALQAARYNKKKDIEELLIRYGAKE